MGVSPWDSPNVSEKDEVNLFLQSLERVRRAAMKIVGRRHASKRRKYY